MLRSLRESEQDLQKKMVLGPVAEPAQMPGVDLTKVVQKHMRQSKTVN